MDLREEAGQQMVERAGSNGGVGGVSGMIYAGGLVGYTTSDVISSYASVDTASGKGNITVTGGTSGNGGNAGDGGSGLSGGSAGGNGGTGGTGGAASGADAGGLAGFSQGVITSLTPIRL